MGWAAPPVVHRLWIRVWTTVVGYDHRMGLILWLVAVVLAVLGVLNLLDGDVLWGIILLIAACAVGPGGWSIFGRNRV